MSGVIFHAYFATHNKLDSVWPTFSSSESKKTPTKDDEHGRKRIEMWQSGQKNLFDKQYN